MTPVFRGLAVPALVLAAAGCRSPQKSAPAPAPTPVAVSTRPVPSTPAPTPAPSPSDSTTKPSVPRPTGGVFPPGAPAPASPRPYDQVITKAAVTRKGLFTTHRVGPKLYFELPPSTLNVDLLLVGRYAQIGSVNPNAGPFAGDQFSKHTLRWERIGNRVLLRSLNYHVVADSAQSVSKAIQASMVGTILASLDVLTFGPDSAAVVDVTPLFTTSSDFSALGKLRPDPARSFIDRVVALPENVEIESTQTGAAETGASTVVAHWSLIKLPALPMRPRIADDRVGFFTVTQFDFGTQQHRAVRREYISRWRLEKKDPNAAMSEPVKPIVYYIDPATPDQWKPFVRAGIEAWQTAFEAAGFKKAIIAKDAPTNDPDWSMEDVRHTVIRWLPSTTENAVGPHVSDPRTGEILNGSIRMFHNILNLQRSWYFTQVAPLDPRVQKWPMPDSLMGRLLQYVVEHEIGHTLGFPHNHKASSTYPLDSLRSKTWVAKMGHVPSLMDYARFNYVAQPEDKIPPALLIPKIGPYDKFAAMWGYAPIPSARTPEDELPTLNNWARMQDTIPWYRFGRGAETGAKGNPDFGDAREAVGDMDAVRASELGIKNIKRIVPMLIPTTVKSGEDYSDLAEIYDRLMRQWSLEVGHVVNIVGGSETQTKYGGQSGAVYTPLSRTRQQDAMRFLNANVWTTPTFLLPADVLSLLDPDGSSSQKLAGMQSGILASLLAPARINRLVEYQARSAGAQDTYSVSELLSTLRSDIWSELSSSSVNVDVSRQRLQRSYIKSFVGILNPPPPPAPNPMVRTQPVAVSPDELVAGVRAELVDLQSLVSAAIPKAANRETQAHLLDVAQRIAVVLKVQ